MIMRLVEHIEKHLGEITQSWRVPQLPGKQVLKFEGQPFAGVDTYCTLGLSNQEVHLASSKGLRCELIFSIKSGKHGDEDIAALLLSLIEVIIDEKKGLLRGEVFHFQTSLPIGINNLYFYCAIPVFFEDEFAVCECESHPIVFIWLIPLQDDDACLIKAKGWNFFEEMLEKCDVQTFWIQMSPLLVLFLVMGQIEGHGSDDHLA
jgi:hypothetical protein